MSHQVWEYEEKVKKFKGKSNHDCYKLIWQWTKEKSIGLSLFEVLCYDLVLRVVDDKEKTAR
jgi:hypothetical protein